MKITWFGQSCFLIEADELTVVTDPYDEKIGLELPKTLRADVVTVSHGHHDHNNVAAVDGNPTAITTGAVTTVHGVAFTGIDAFHDNVKGTARGPNVIFKFTLDGVTLAHLGDLGHLLSKDQAAALQGTDILMIPVGGKYTLDPAMAVQVVEQVKPKIVIPMHYRVEGLGLALQPVEPFLEKSPLRIRKMNVLETSLETLPQIRTAVILKLTGGS